MTTQVEAAKGVLRGLAKLFDARARHAETQAKAMELAYPANTGDESARKRLDGLNAKGAMVATEVVSLEAAIVTAKRHVADAEAVEVDEAERGKARDALALLDDFSQRGKLLDESLDKFVRQYDELARDFRALQLLGYEPTSYPVGTGQHAGCRRDKIAIHRPSPKLFGSACQAGFYFRY
jgi:hypothetical protein